MKTLYEILGIRRTATPEQITKAYRKLAVKYHPDVAKGDPEAAAHKFREVQEAYDVLSDPERRKLYDETGSTVPPGRKQDGVMLSLLALQKMIFEQAESSLSELDVFAEMRSRIKSGMQISMQEKQKAEKSAHRFHLAAGRMLPDACCRRLTIRSARPHCTWRSRPRNERNRLTWSSASTGTRWRRWNGSRCGRIVRSRKPAACSGRRCSGIGAEPEKHAERPMKPA
jgi:curved DNA-binding protein CbpA